MAAPASRLAAWAERRLPALTRLRRAEDLPVTLGRRRIYILPTRFGAGFALLLAVMLTGALNYANNAALLLTCLVGGASAASMFTAFRTLHRLRLVAIRAGHAVAGEALEITLEFDAPRAASGLRVSLAGEVRAFALEARATGTLTHHVATVRRGWQELPRLKLWTTWPLGLFRAWSWVHPRQAVLVWPRAEATGPAPDDTSNTAHHTRLHRGDELATLRDYRQGDPPRHIAWKASARHDALLVREFEQPEAAPERVLDWRRLSHLAPEARIARLARWVGEAHVERARYSLWLPGRVIAAGSGPQQYVRCMNALAELP